jgi:hypothetical protein
MLLHILFVLHFLRLIYGEENAICFGSSTVLDFLRTSMVIERISGGLKRLAPDFEKSRLRLAASQYQNITSLEPSREELLHHLLDYDSKLAPKASADSSWPLVKEDRYYPLQARNIVKSYRSTISSELTVERVMRDIMVPLTDAIKRAPKEYDPEAKRATLLRQLKEDNMSDSSNRHGKLRLDPGATDPCGRACA